MQPTSNGLLASILAAQNEDGGWSYRPGGGSWTEPSAYALLALTATGESPEAIRRGTRWIARTQRPDGGWGPRLSVDQSTWVTALAVLLLAEQPHSSSATPAVEWLLAQTGRESAFLQRLRQRLLGAKLESDENSRGWPWFPGTAAWVSPTALSILALEKMSRREPRPECEQRVEMGRRFLFDKMCQDGGWNHGSSRALGYEAASYPETTGVALLALHAARSDRLPKAIAAGERHIRQSKSAEGQSWLRLGLLAYSRSLSGVELKPAKCRTVMDCSLAVLANAAASGKNVFLD